MKQTAFDILIVGGGMVGASLACALGTLPLDVALVEAIPPGSSGQPSYDDRTTGLSLGTRRIYEALGLWPALDAAAEPIRRIHVSERGRFGVTRMEAREQGADALGYIVENRLLGRVLGERMDGLPRLSRFCPARFTGIGPGEDRRTVSIEDDAGSHTLLARLVVGADGADSRLRAALGIGADIRDYGQTAIVANVTPERAHDGTAYERFTPDGPVALLPMSAGRCALVWTLPTARAEAVLALDDASFLAALQAAFGHRLGELQRAGRRNAYPLRRVISRETALPRVLLIGNAAHTLHPVAAQGFNLGLRDVAMLAEVLADACTRGLDPGDAAVSERYAAGRRDDHAHVSEFTDGLVRLFSNRLPGLASLRHLGLLGLDLLPPVKARFTRRSMGMVGAPRLSRGLPLTDELP
jgi:2-octaprenyl-6-methoxyphenol hydroxylase